MRSFVCLVLLASALTGCGEKSQPVATSAAAAPVSAPSAPAAVEITERYVTAADVAANIDSVAVSSGEPALLYATAKTGDVLKVFDASNGQPKGSIGAAGTQLGQLERPNGIVAIDDLLVVVERDNHRVQVFGLPQARPLAVLGADKLRKPYGLWLHRLSANRYRLYVTDNYEMPDESVPPAAELGERVKTWLIDVERDGKSAARAVSATFEKSFGDTSGPGTLRVVESIWGDPEHDRLMLAEEDPAGGRVLKVYTLAGKFTGRILGEGLFKTQPEGIALYACAGGSGYWISTDQDHQRNIFYVFDRATLEPRGAFSGVRTRNTDGIWLAQQPLPAFPSGAFFAVHDDQAVSAFDWREVMVALRLTGCTSGGG